MLVWTGASVRVCVRGCALNKDKILRFINNYLTCITPGCLRRGSGGDRDPRRWGKQKTERERDKQTDRQTDRQRQRQRNRETETDRERASTKIICS